MIQDKSTKRELTGIVVTHGMNQYPFCVGDVKSEGASLSDILCRDYRNAEVKITIEVIGHADAVDK